MEKQLKCCLPCFEQDAVSSVGSLKYHPVDQLLIFLRGIHLKGIKNEMPKMRI